MYVIITEASKLAKKLPEIFQNFVSKLKEEGVNVPNVFVSAKMIDSLKQERPEGVTDFDKQPLDIFLEEAGISREEFETSLASGSTLEIQGERLHKILQTDIGMRLLRDNAISTSSRFETDGMDSLLISLYQQKKMQDNAENLVNSHVEATQNANAVDVDYKDHKLTEIEIAPALYHGVLENKQSMQEASAISNVSLGVLREKVKPFGISENTLYQLAYHGTPHNFDKFTLDHIGSGEGAQAHGWGLYFAKNKGTSEEYRKHLATNIYLDDEVFYNGIKGKLEKSTGNSIADDALLVSHGDIDKAISDVQNDVDYGIPKAKEAITILQDIKNNNRLKSENKGQLFEVDIPENDVLLDEQKPFSKQPAKVKKALVKLYADNGKDIYENMTPFYQPTGEEIYSAIKYYFAENSAQKASKLLNEYGIKGITS